jgi:hypothetical protein
MVIIMMFCEIHEKMMENQWQKTMISVFVMSDLFCTTAKKKKGHYFHD